MKNIEHLETVCKNFINNPSPETKAELHKNNLTFLDIKTQKPLPVYTNKQAFESNKVILYDKINGLFTPIGIYLY